MRVIAGTAGGIALRAPRAADLRPTMDQVRAAIFSSLAERVPGARVLDLFAGTGALGIEALSRGARGAVFVERSRRAADCLLGNLEKTRLGGAAAVVLCQEVFAYLSRRAEAEAPFDLVFADPPYTSREQPEDFAARLLSADALMALLAPGGLFVLEKSPRHPLPKDALARWEILRQKRYGGTEVVFLAGKDAAPAPDDLLR